MPQIAVAAAASWAGSYMAGTALSLTAGTFVYNLVAAGTAFFVSDLLGDMLGLTPDDPIDQSLGLTDRSIGVNSRLAVAPINVPYGIIRNVGGNIEYQGVNDSVAINDNQFLDTVISLGCGEVDEISNIYVNEENIRSHLQATNTTIVSYPLAIYLPWGRRPGLAITINGDEYKIQGSYTTVYDISDLVTKINADKPVGATWVVEAVGDDILSVKEETPSTELLVTNARVAVNGTVSATGHVFTPSYPYSSSDVTWDFMLGVNANSTTNIQLITETYGTNDWKEFIGPTFRRDKLIPQIHDSTNITTGEYVGLYTINSHVGSATQSVDSDALENIFGWQSSMTGKGVAYLYARATFDIDKITSIPRYTADIKGRKIKNWDTVAEDWQTNFSNNAAWVIRDYLTNAVYGVGVDEELIDDTSFKAAAVICDTSFYAITNLLMTNLVNVASSTVIENQFSTQEWNGGTRFYLYKAQSAWASSNLVIEDSRYDVSGDNFIGQASKEIIKIKNIGVYAMAWAVEDGVNNYEFYPGVYPHLDKMAPVDGNDHYRFAVGITNETSSDSDNANYAVEITDMNTILNPEYEYYQSPGNVEGTVEITFSIKELGVEVASYVETLGTNISAWDGNSGNLEHQFEVHFSHTLSSSELSVNIYKTGYVYGSLPILIKSHTFTTATSGNYYARAYHKDRVNFRMNHSFYDGVRATIDGMVPIRTTPFNNLKEMLLSCRGLLHFSGGMFKLKIDAEETGPVVMSFNKTNILGDWKIHMPSSYDAFNRLKVTFPNNAKNGEPDIVVIDSSSIRDTFHNGVLVEKEVTLPYTTDISKARALAMFSLKQSQFQKACSFVAFSNAHQLEIGDIVDITHDIPGWTAKKFRVMGINMRENGEVEIKALEYSDDIYDISTDDIDGSNFISDGDGGVEVVAYTDNDIVDHQPITSALVIGPQDTGYSVSVAANGGRVMKVNWDSTAYSNVKNTTVEVGGAVDSTGAPYSSSLTTRASEVSFDGIQNGEYTVLIYNTSYSGKKSSTVSFTAKVIGMPLPIPTHLAIDTGDYEGVGDDSTEWGGRDCKILWSRVSFATAVEINDEEPTGADGSNSIDIEFIVEVYDSAGSLIFTDTAKDPHYTFTYDENKNSTGGPHRELGFRVYSTSTSGNFTRSLPAIL